VGSAFSLRQNHYTPTMVSQYEVTFDGGSLGNPGKGYGSYAIVTRDGPRDVVRLDYSKNGEIVTNNQAEYRTLIAALESIRKESHPDEKSISIQVFGDSKLVIEQLKGAWKVKHPDLKPLHAQAAELVKRFGRVELIWRGRAWAVQILGH
jgi:ribonuclease HI